MTSDGGEAGVDGRPAGSPDDVPTFDTWHTTTAAGFDEFFSAHHAPVVRALSVTLGDDDFGRDAAAEGFARALERWNRIGHYDEPAGWVYRVGVNWARSRRRKTRRETAESAAIAETEAPDRVDGLDPRLTRALLSLSVDHRAVVVGRYLFDWSEKELADALGIRPGTVKSRLSRALARLADELDDPSDQTRPRTNREAS